MRRVLTISSLTVLISLALFAMFRGSQARAAVTIPDPVVDETVAPQKSSSTIVLAGGCFWGLQVVYEHVKGVKRVTAGYSGGTVKNPNYEEVSSGATGHAESVEILYDPAKVTVGQLLKVFFSVAHDPTELNRQGPDTGTQYRSAIFFFTPDHQRIAQAYVDQLNQAKVFRGPIVTQIVSAKSFYRAEEYHQDYAVQHPNDPYIARFDLPKVRELQATFPNLYH